MCQTIILSQCENSAISLCEDCQTVFVWYHNFVLTFSGEEFTDFNKVINKLPFDGNQYPFPDGEDRLLLRTPNPDISFCFSSREFEAFKVVADEALYMKQVYAMVKQH